MWVFTELCGAPAEQLPRRPGILVLINDSDWELEGEGSYQLQPGDEIVFISTLHGGWSRCPSDEHDWADFFLEELKTNYEVLVASHSQKFVGFPEFYAYDILPFIHLFHRPYIRSTMNLYIKQSSRYRQHHNYECLLTRKALWGWVRECGRSIYWQLIFFMKGVFKVFALHSRQGQRYQDFALSFGHK